MSRHITRSWCACSFMINTSEQALLAVCAMAFSGLLCARTRGRQAAPGGGHAPQAARVRLIQQVHHHAPGGHRIGHDVAQKLRPVGNPLSRVRGGRGVEAQVVIDEDVEAVGGERADNVQKAVIDGVVGQLLVADAVGRARAARARRLRARRAPGLARRKTCACRSMQQAMQSII